MPSDLISAYKRYLLSESRSERTREDRARILTVIDAELPYGLDGACEDELRDWLWQDGWELSTRETYYGAFADFFKWAHEAGHFDFNPAENISRPKPPQRLPNPVTDKEFMDVLARAREPYLLYVKLAGYAGCRCLDISHLRRERITEEGISIIQSKGGKARVVPTHPVIWDAVKDLPHGPIAEQDERQISICTANYFSRNLKLKGVTLHRFRHWFGTMIQRLHKDLRVTQELMGHADPRTTAGYALVAADQARAAVDLLPTFASVSPASGLAADRAGS